MTKIEEMLEYCEKNKVFWFCDLANYAAKKRSDWFRTLVTERGSKILGFYLANKAYEAGLLTLAAFEEWEEDFYTE